MKVIFQNRRGYSGWIRSQIWIGLRVWCLCRVVNSLIWYTTWPNICTLLTIMKISLLENTRVMGSWVCIIMFEIFGMPELNERCKILLTSHVAIPFTTSRKSTNVPFVLFLTIDREKSCVSVVLLLYYVFLLLCHVILLFTCIFIVMLCILIVTCILIVMLCILIVTYFYC